MKTAPVRGIRHWWSRLAKPTRSTWLAACLVLGYLLQQLQWLDQSAWLIAVLVTMVGVLLSRWSTRRGWRVCGFLLVLVALGGFWSQWRQPGNHVAFRQLIPEDAEQIQVIRVRGTVVSLTETPPLNPRDIFESFQFTVPKFKFVVRTDSYEAATGWESLSGRLDCALESDLPIDDEGVAQIATFPEGGANVKVGQRLEMLGRISLPPPAKNPRQLDHRRLLWRCGLDCQLTINKPGQIKVLQADGDLTALGDR
ncbi:MAG: DUF4131 domain-containing protein, partial [Planctomycetaceae bacterium]|nr:DUF4131 domain-containing protein [Planctomycetaceae bacterium]